MDRVLVSWSIPNLITINLMAWIGILFAICLFQVYQKRGKDDAPANNSGGY